MTKAKRCLRCKEHQDIKAFSRDATRKDGLHPHCKACRRAYGTPYARIQRRENPELREKQRERNRIYRQNNRERLLAYAKARPRDYMKNSFIKSTYGITLIEYEAMLEAQGGVCAICGEKETRKNRYTGICRLHIDHDHKTGEVRGLLCSSCNFALGGFRDDPEILIKAMKYLIKGGNLQ